MAKVTKSKTFTAGTVAVSGDVNTNFDTIYNEFNGSIDNDNIKAGAGIVDSKLAQIATAGKVSGAALTSLSSVPASAGTFNTAGSVSGKAFIELASIATNAGTIPAKNLEAVAWADYGSTSTIVGWADFAQKEIYYKKIGNTVFVNFVLNGTSNAGAATFTLPYINNGGIQVAIPSGQIYNNGSPTDTVGLIYLAENSTSVAMYATMMNAAFATGNQKIIQGQFFYESA